MSKIIDKIRELEPVMAEVSSGLTFSTGLMGKDLIIKDWRGDVIGWFHAEKTETKERSYGETSYRRTPIKGARERAEAVVKAYNAMHELIRLAATEGALDETAWLIEWPADRYGPIRYYSHGEPPVVEAGEATRFARQCDAERVAKVEKLTGHKVADHKWITKPREEEAADVVA